MSDDFLNGLACAALEPGLRQVLLLDTDLSVLSVAASKLRDMLQVTTNYDVAIVNLPVTAQADDLWGKYVPRRGNEQPSADTKAEMNIVWEEGWLTKNRQQDRWVVIVIADLSLLTLPAIHACLMLMDTSVVHLERHGQHLHWQPRICWLASCPYAAVGKVSPHLLDRFSLRLSPSTASEKHGADDV